MEGTHVFLRHLFLEDSQSTWIFFNFELLLGVDLDFDSRFQENGQSPGYVYSVCGFLATGKMTDFIDMKIIIQQGMVLHKSIA